MGGLSSAGRAGLALAASLVFSAPALAVNPAQERYEACLARVGENPEAGYEEGLAWRAQGGGWPAQHCAALGLIAMGETELGARRMLTNAEFAVTASDATRAIMYGQAGDAFLMANLPDRALTAFQRGRDFAPQDAGLALGVADAAHAAGRWDVVEDAATIAIGLDGGEGRAFRLRSEARLEAGELDAAEADMDEARRLDPDDIEALLLRGRINEVRRGAAPLD